MLIPDIGSSLPSIFSMLGTLFAIWMLVDCIRNNALRHKGLWIMFILFIQPIGGFVYFFTQGPWPKVKKFLLSHRPAPMYQAPPSAQPKQETYSAYEQGYQAQALSAAPTFQESEQPTPAPSPLQPQYERPQISYPEPPQMQQY